MNLPQVFMSQQIIRQILKPDISQVDVQIEIQNWNLVLKISPYPTNMHKRVHPTLTSKRKTPMGNQQVTTTTLATAAVQAVDTVQNCLQVVPLTGILSTPIFEFTNHTCFTGVSQWFHNIQTAPMHFESFNESQSLTG